MELKNTRYEISDIGVATVWFHRPDRANAWTGHLHREYRWIFSQLQANPAVRVAIVTGTGAHFSVGADSNALDVGVERGYYDPGLGEGTANPGYGIRADFDHDLAWQWALPFPVIAAVNGGCAGVALSLACFCDMRFGAASAKLTTAAPKLGLPAEYGMSWQLPRLVGVTRANDLLLSGRVCTPAETEGWGLWNGVEADGEATLTAARAYAHLLAHGVGPHALTTTKSQIYRDLLHHSPAAAIDDAQRLLEQAMTTAEYREGVAALREKRAPNFE